MAKSLAPTIAVTALLMMAATASAGASSSGFFSSSWSRASSSDASSSAATARPTEVFTPPPTPATPTPTAAPCTLGYQTRTIPHVAVSGTSVNVPIKVNSGCSTTDTFSVRLVDPTIPDDLYWGYSYSKRVSYSWQHRHLVSDSRNYMAGSVTIGGATTMATATVTPYCLANDTMFTITLVSSSGAMYSAGQVYCVLPYPTQCASAKPTKLNTWVSTTNYLVLANALLVSWQNWVPTASYLTAGQLTEANFMMFTNFTAFQNQANMYVDGSSTNVADSCNAFAAATHTFPVSTGLIVLGGNYYGSSCATTGATNAFNVVKGWLLVTDVIVADGSVSASVLTNSETQTVTLGYPTASTSCIRKTLERYCISRFERATTVCGTSSNLVSIPSTGSFVSGSMLDERTFRWNGVCGVTSCCIGSMCSTQIATDGRSCVLPRIPSYGTQVGVTLKRGTESFYIHVYFENTWGYDVYVQTRSYWRGSEPALTDDASGLQVKFTRYSGASYCFQLSCIPSAGSLASGGITAYSNTICPAEADWQSPWWIRYYQSLGYNYYYYWVWTSYRWTQYGWEPYSWYNNNEYRATFTRPSAQAACGCSAIGLSSWSSCSMTFPVNTRKFDATITTGVAMAANWVTKSFTLTDIAPLSKTAVATDRHSYCSCWAKRDAVDTTVAHRLAVASSCFMCPATVTTNGVLPRGFWQIWGWGQSWWNQYFGEVGNTNQLCFRSAGAWASNQRLGWERRCCYERDSTVTGVWKYIPGYPSKLSSSVGWGSWPDYYTERLFYYANEVNPESVCCRDGAGMDATTSTCRLFRDRRPVEFATTSPFTLPRGCNETWTPQPPRGWGNGDPYCSTMDGAGFECNFWGEALWTSCGSWKVHAAAEPLSTGAKATVIAAVAVAEGNETVVIQRNNETNDCEVRINGGDVITEDYSGSYLSVALEVGSNNLTLVRVVSVAGTHEVTLQTLNASLTLSVAPAATCIGTCSGLMGNCDGDASNDIKSRDGTVSLPSTASSEAIFHNVVVSYLINNTAQSLFDYVVSVPPNTTTFVPKFVTATTLANCPTSCNGNPGCCLDNEVAGPTFAAETVATISVIKAAKNQSVPLTGYNWPPTVSANPNVRVLTGLTISQDISAMDTDGLTSLTIDACTATDVTCTRDTTVNAATTLKYKLTMTASRNFTVTITAIDTMGAKTVSYIDIKSLPPPPPPANYQSLTFIIPGSGFNAGHVYEARNALARDLASIVNAYWNLNRRQTVTVAPGTAGAPAYTAASQFTVSAVANVATGVQVTVYVAGDTAAEAMARYNALAAQTSLTLSEVQTILAQLVSTAVTTTTTAPTTGTTPGTGTGTTTGTGSSNSNSGSTTTTTTGNGAVHMSALATIIVALIASIML